MESGDGDAYSAGGRAHDSSGSSSDGEYSSSPTEDSWSADELGLGDDDGDDSLEAYDLWDEQDDLAKVPEPVYLDQLIERECSRRRSDFALLWVGSKALISTPTRFPMLWCLLIFANFWSESIPRGDCCAAFASPPLIFCSSFLFSFVSLTPPPAPYTLCPEQLCLRPPLAMGRYGAAAKDPSDRF